MSSAAPVVVTGATGFVGRRLVGALLERGTPVRALVRSPATATLDARADVRPFDLARPEELSAHAAGASAIVHVAAFIPPSYVDPAHAEECVRVNALGTLALTQAAERAGVRRLVAFSSGNVYTPASGHVREDAPVYPAERATYYLASKLLGELYVDHARRAGRVDATVLRVSSVYGPGMKPVGLIPTFLSRLRAGERITVQDGGRYKVDLVYVDDVVQAALLSLDREGAGLGPLNVGSGEHATTLDVAYAACDALGVPRDRVVVEPPSGGAAGAGFAGLDIGRAREILGYAPRGLREGMRDLVRAGT